MKFLNFIALAGNLVLGDEVPPECSPKFDLMVLQDASRSLQPELDELNKILPEFFRTLAKDVFVDSRIGLGFFVDKPTTGNYVYDSCVNLKVNLTDDIDTFIAGLQKATADGGQDWRENQLGAMMRVALSPQTGWTEGVESSEATKRVMFVVTDSLPNYAPSWKEDRIPKSWGSFDKIPFTYEDFGLTDVSAAAKILADDINAKCQEYEYPTWEQWAAVMKSREITPVFLVKHAWYNCDGKECIWNELYDESEKEFGKGVWDRFADRESGLADYYAYKSASVGVETVTLVYNDNLDKFIEQSFEALKKTLPTYCPPVTTTTDAPTTLMPSTTIFTSTIATTTASTAYTTTDDDDDHECDHCEECSDGNCEVTYDCDDCDNENSMEMLSGIAKNSKSSESHQQKREMSTWGNGASGPAPGAVPYALLPGTLQSSSSAKSDDNDDHHDDKHKVQGPSI